MTDSGNESFEGINSKDSRGSDKRLASKMNKIRSTACSAVQNDSEQGRSTLTAKPSSGCKKGGKRESHPRPANCTYLLAPRVNTDIWNIMLRICPK